MKVLDDIDDVLDRVRADPMQHLSCKSLDALTAYVMGYESACVRWGLPIPSGPDPAALSDWLHAQVEVTEEHSGRLNAFNWLNLDTWTTFLAADDRDAFDLYFELRERANVAKVPAAVAEWSSPDGESLVALLRRIQARPGMYFGNAFRMVQVWAFCSGYRWAERDAGIAESSAEPLFTFFPRWLEARYPFSRGVPWHRLFHVLALGHPQWAFGHFMEHLDLYLAGESPDTEDPTMKAILANILAQHAKSKGE